MAGRKYVPEESFIEDRKKRMHAKKILSDERLEYGSGRNAERTLAFQIADVRGRDI